MGAGLTIYRGLTWGLGFVLPATAGFGPPESAWRGALTGASEEGAMSAGSVWVHAASLGEVGAARRWVDALIESGVRPPLLLTTRTRAGLARARREMSGRVAARIAPLDLPQTVRALLDGAAPTRLDIVETEAWPNLILEARRAGVAVVFVSGTVSARTERRLLALGVAGQALFGDGVFALVQDAEAAGRFRALGVPESRVRIAGDLKADLPELTAGPIPPESSRMAVVFGSFRPGEEDALLAIADALERETAESGLGWRPILVAAPRHAEGAERARHALTQAGYVLAERTERDRAMPLSQWIASAASRPGKRAALLATHGELLGVYDHARAAVIGGTFASFGGHSPLEAAARGCPILVGPHHEAIAETVHAIAREGGGAIAPDAASVAALAAAWWSDGGFSSRSAGARRAAASRAGAAKRGLEALAEWRLTP